MTTQTDLFDPTVPADITDGDRLRAHLTFWRTWRTRSQICEALGWSERQVRDAAEQLGSAIVRGQLGLKLTGHIGRDDMGVAIQSADAFVSQGKKMIRYGLSLRRRLHQVIG